MHGALTTMTTIQRRLALRAMWVSIRRMTAADAARIDVIWDAIFCTRTLTASEWRPTSVTLNATKATLQLVITCAALADGLPEAGVLAMFAPKAATLIAHRLPVPIRLQSSARSGVTRGTQHRARIFASRTAALSAGSVRPIAAPRDLQSNIQILRATEQLETSAILNAGQGIQKLQPTCATRMVHSREGVAPKILRSVHFV